MDVLVLNADVSPVSLFPISTLSWRAAIKAVFLDSVSVVEEYEAWEVHSPSTTMRVPSVVMTRQFLHYNRGVSYSDEHIFLRDRYTCQYCGKVASPKNLTLDHVIPASHGGKTTWDNITTACPPCNFKKGNDARIVPSVKPRKPTYYEMLAIRKEYPLMVPCPSWTNYLSWPEDKLLFSNKKILRSSI